MSSLEKWNKNTALVLNNNQITIKQCLTAPHISTLISEYGFREIADRIIKELKNINTLYGFSVDENYYPLFVDFIIQTYKFESMQDIVMCLRNGTNGKYGKPFKQLDPATFQNDWMSQHLEQKAIERENQHQKNKHDFKTREEYVNAVQVGSENKKKADKIRESNKDDIIDYNNFKMKYESSKGNESIKGTIKPKK